MLQGLEGISKTFKKCIIYYFASLYIVLLYIVTVYSAADWLPVQVLFPLVIVCDTVFALYFQ